VLREAGCEHPVVIPANDFVARVKEVSGGKGASIVYDSIGKATFEGSLDSAARFALIVSFGWPSGDPDVSLMTLRNKGSLAITRPTVTHFVAETEDFRAGAQALFGLIRSGDLRIKVGNRYRLRDAPQAHADLAARRTVGSVVLVP
jgi:NADPH2:quinone reductase